MAATRVHPGRAPAHHLRALARTSAFDAVVLVAAAAALRLPGLFTDFWLDEIESYERFARRASSVLDIFLNPAFRHDNNHHLNTVFLYLFRDHSGWVVYRWPSFAAGLATVALVVWAGRRRSRVEGAISGVLVATSYLMGVYSTEARGYALVLLFALLGFMALQRFLDAPSRRAAVPFWLCVALGLAAQSSIAYFYAGALLWSGYRLRGRVKDLAWLHAVPIVWALTWAAVVLRGSRVGGGDPWTWQAVTDQSLAWTIGYPLAVVPALVAVIGAGALVLWDAGQLWREGSDEGLFYVGVVLGPPIFIAALNPPWLFARYFLVSLFFFLLVIGRALARLWRRPGWGPPLALGLIGAMAVGNLSHTVLFWRYGRGAASQAIAYVVSHASTPQIVVGSPSVALWSTLPIAFYERKLGLGDRIRFVSRDAVAAGAPLASIAWVLVPSQPRRQAAPSSLELAPGFSYVLRKSYAAYGPSAMSWAVYERVTRDR